MMYEKKRKEMMKRAKEKIARGEAFRGKAGIPPKDYKGAIKKRICNFFVNFKRTNKLSNVELGKIIDMSESQTSRMLAYHIDHFTLDRLVDALESAAKKDKQISPSEILLLK